MSFTFTLAPITHTFLPSSEDLGEKAVPSLEAIKEYTFPAAAIKEGKVARMKA